MSDTNETFADIIAEMRGYSHGMPDAYHVTMSWHDFRVVLARLEAAHNREFAAGGNAAKLRGALKLCIDDMCNRCRDLAAAHGNPLPCLSGCEPVRKAKAALAEPLLNCEGGTPEEQTQKFEAFCSLHHLPKGKGCYSCPALPTKSPYAFHRDTCRINWAQMPYEAEEGGAE